MRTGAPTGLSSPSAPSVPSTRGSPALRPDLKPQLENAAKTVAWVLGSPHDNNDAPQPRKNIDGWVQHRLRQHFRRIERRLGRLDVDACTQDLQDLTRMLADRLRADHRRHRSTSPDAVRLLKKTFGSAIRGLWAAAENGDLPRYREALQQFRSTVCAHRLHRTAPGRASSTDRCLAVLAQQITLLDKAHVPHKNRRRSLARTTDKASLAPSLPALPDELAVRRRVGERAMKARTALRWLCPDLLKSVDAMKNSWTDGQRCELLPLLTNCRKAADKDDHKAYRKALEPLSDAIEGFDSTTATLKG